MSYLGPLNRNAPQDYLEKRNKLTFSKAVIDENDLPHLGKRDDLPFNDIKCYTYKHTSMSWDEFYSQGDEVDNGKYGVIYRCVTDWGWKSSLKNNVMGNSREEFS